MKIVRKLTKNNYHPHSNVYYPIDNYDGELRKSISEISEGADSFSYFFIKVPLLGQCVHLKTKTNWCGRTAATMLLNYCTLLEQGDAKEHYVKMWAPDGNIMQLRKSDKTVQTKTPNPLCGTTYEMPHEELLPFCENRMKVAEQIAKSEMKIRDRFKAIIESIEKGSPVLMYTFFSNNKGHIILLCGHAYINDELWILIADPEEDPTARWKTNVHTECLTTDVKNVNTARDNNCVPDVIILVRGDWSTARASLRLVRARRFFEKNPNHGKKYLMMDYRESSIEYGKYFHSHKMLMKQGIPPELLEASSKSRISFPFDGTNITSSPMEYYFMNESLSYGLGGYYGIGLQRNFHGGVHLLPQPNNEKVQQQKDTAFTSGPISASSDKVRIKELQEKLIKLGYDLPKHGADSDFGSETEGALKIFQQHAANKKRIISPQFDKLQEISTVTFKGSANSVADIESLQELLLWEKKGYFNPNKQIKGILYKEKTNSDIVEMQKRLISCGYPVSSATGYFGRQTQNALKEFLTQALNKKRAFDGKVISVSPTYSGTKADIDSLEAANEIIQNELLLWCRNGYSNPNKLKKTSAERKGIDIPSDMTAVRSMAPGYIVAMRLPGLNSWSNNKSVIEAIRNNTGFVLVRHEFMKKLPEDATEEEREKETKYAFYSLYMHLASPKYNNLIKDPYYNESQWFQEIFKKENGSWIKLSTSDPKNKDDFERGDIVWSVKKATEGSAKGTFKVFNDNFQESEITSFNTETGIFDWIYKDAPVDYSQIINGLKAGRVVTFTEPLITVDAGDILGYVQPVKNLSKKSIIIPDKKDKEQNTDDDKTKDQTKKSGLKYLYESGFLHWEVLVPEGEKKDGLKELLKFANDIKINAFPEMVEGKKQNNFLDDDEFEKTLSGVLPESDVDRFSKAFSNKTSDAKGLFSYAPAILELLNEPPELMDDAKDEAGITLKDTWPATLTLINENGYLGEPGDNKTYEIDLSFYKNRGTTKIKNASGKLIINGDKYSQQKDGVGHLKGDKVITFAIRIPFEADHIELIERSSCFKILVTPPIGSTENAVMIFNEAVKYRWRNVQLKHVNEWSRNGISELVKCLKNNAILPQNTDVKNYYPLAWWDPGFSVAVDVESEKEKKEVVKNPSEAGLLTKSKKDEAAKTSSSKELLEESVVGKKETSVFEKILPAKAKLNNLHPVTTAWLLKILEREKISMVTEFIPDKFQDKETQKSLPVCWGWLDYINKEFFTIGELVQVFVIDDDYSYGRKKLVKLSLVSPDTKIELGYKSYTHDGYMVEPVAIPVWGKWNLHVNDEQKPSQSTMHTTEISVTKPDLFPLSEQECIDEKLKDFLPIKVSDDVWQWNIRVAEYEMLQPRFGGFLKLKHSTDKKTWKDSGYYALAMPVESKIKDIVFPERKLKENLLNVELDDDISIITGVSETGRKSDINSVKVTSNIGYTNYRDAYPIKISCSLAQAVQKLKDFIVGQYPERKVRILYLSRDGLICRLSFSLGSDKDKNDKIVAYYKSSDAGFSEATELSKGVIEVAVDKKSLKTVGKCDKLNGFAYTVKINKKVETRIDKFKLSSDDLFIIGLAKNTSKSQKITANFGFDEYNKYKEIRLHKNLAMVLQKLIVLSRKMIINEISAEGDMVKIAGHSYLKDAEKLKCLEKCEKLSKIRKEVLIKIYVPQKNKTAIQFNMKDIKNFLYHKLDWTNVAGYYISADFIAVNGCEAIMKNHNNFSDFIPDIEIGEADDKNDVDSVEVPLLAQADYDVVADIAKECITYQFSKSITKITSLRFGNTKFNYFSDGSTTYLVGTLELLGNWQFWKGLNIIVDVDGHHDPKENKLRKSMLQQENRFFLFMVDVSGASNKNAITISISAEHETDSGRIVPDPITLSYDLTPRLEGLGNDKDKLVVEYDKNNKFLYIRCRAYGMNVPPLVVDNEVRDALDWNKEGIADGHGHEFELIVKNDGELVDSNEIQYKLTRNYGEGIVKNGFIDEHGLFEARIAYSDLIEDLPYDFILRRIKKKPNGEIRTVRDQTVAPINAQYTFKEQSDK